MSMIDMVVDVFVQHEEGSNSLKKVFSNVDASGFFFGQVNKASIEMAVSLLNEWSQMSAGFDVVDLEEFNATKLGCIDHRNIDGKMYQILVDINVVDKIIAFNRVMRKASDDAWDILKDMNQKASDDHISNVREKYGTEFLKFIREFG